MMHCVKGGEEDRTMLKMRLRVLRSDYRNENNSLICLG
jgi:hypothetical protein